MPALNGEWVFNEEINCNVGCYAEIDGYKHDIIFVVENGICCWDNIAENLSGYRFYYVSEVVENPNIYPFSFSQLTINGITPEDGKTNAPEVGHFIFDPLGRLFKIVDVYGNTAEAIIYTVLDFVYTVSDGWDDEDCRNIDFGSDENVSGVFYNWVTSNALRALDGLKKKIVTVESLALLHENDKNVYMTKINPVGSGTMIINGDAVFSGNLNAGSITINSNIKLVPNGDGMELVFLN